jgi:hypothetical protein
MGQQHRLPAQASQRVHSDRLAGPSRSVLDRGLFDPGGYGRSWARPRTTQVDLLVEARRTQHLKMVDPVPVRHQPLHWRAREALDGVAWRAIDQGERNREANQQFLAGIVLGIMGGTLVAALDRVLALATHEAVPPAGPRGEPGPPGPRDEPAPGPNPAAQESRGTGRPEPESGRQQPMTPSNATAQAAGECGHDEDQPASPDPSPKQHPPSDG